MKNQSPVRLRPTMWLGLTASTGEKVGLVHGGVKLSAAESRMYCAFTHLVEASQCLNAIKNDAKTSMQQFYIKLSSII